MANPRYSEHPTERALRRCVLAILLFGTVGTLAELLLLEHYEEWWQRVPLLLLGVAAPLIAWCALFPSARALKSLRGLMLLFVVAGALGVYQHYTGNAEFELEMYPSRAGLELFWESLKGATPALAPASLSWLGLIGLAYVVRHPALAAGPVEPPRNS
jgi:hypothetical protein